MVTNGNGTTLSGSDNASIHDKLFLLNFITITYLGPDVFSDNPRCSAFQRLAAMLPPYTSNNLGTSFLSISQLESIYYYVLRNAHPSLLLEPNMLHQYVKGSLHLPLTMPPGDHKQFTSFFPFNLHAHKKYSEHHEIVKGIVLIYDPVTSYMKKEDLERFRCLSGMHDLRIDVKNCLSYCPEHQKTGQEIEPTSITNRTKEQTGTVSDRNERSSALFQKTYKRRRFRDSKTIPRFSISLSIVKQHNEETASEGTGNKNVPATMPVITPNLKNSRSKKSIVLSGTAKRGSAGPQVGTADIGISRSAYYFQVALPGVRRDFCEFSCEIESNGKVLIQGTLSGGGIIKKRSRVFRMKFRRLCPAGPFTLAFNLPGPVDPRFFSPNFRTDGIFEAVVLKRVKCGP